MAVMALETQKTFNPSKQNSFGYTGLIQFGNAAASRLGTTTSGTQNNVCYKSVELCRKIFQFERI